MVKSTLSPVKICETLDSCQTPWWLGIILSWKAPAPNLIIRQTFPWTEKQLVNHFLSSTYSWYLSSVSVTLTECVPQAAWRITFYLALALFPYQHHKLQGVCDISHVRKPGRQNRWRCCESLCKEEKAKTQRQLPGMSHSLWIIPNIFISFFALCYFWAFFLSSKDTVFPFRYS